MYYHQFKIKGLELILTGDQDGISRLMILNGTQEPAINKEWQEDECYFKEAKKQLQEYFEGKRFCFNLKLNPQGTPFQKQVWQALKEIPFGELRSYKDIACVLGNPNASRAVGMANNKNPLPLIIPCHRVVGSNKKLVGYAYGTELKQHLLTSEKIHLLFSHLRNFYGHIARNTVEGRRSCWPGNNAFEVMVGAILTQNTNWKNVEKALDTLKPQLTPQSIMEMPEEELASKIRTSGYHNQKAIKL